MQKTKFVLTVDRDMSENDQFQVYTKTVNNSFTSVTLSKGDTLSFYGLVDSEGDEVTLEVIRTHHRLSDVVAYRKKIFVKYSTGKSTLSEKSLLQKGWERAERAALISND